MILKSESSRTRSRFRLLLVTPPYRPCNLADEKVYIVEPIQFEVLASLLDPTRFEVRVLDLRQERSKDAFDQALRSFHPHMIGATSWTMHIVCVRKLMARAKAFNPSVLTVVGGHHAGIAPWDFADRTVDFVLMGEAYASFPALMERVAGGARCYDGIPGLAHQDAGAFHSQGQGVVHRSFDLDCLPFPKRAIVRHYRDRYYHLWWKPVASLRTGLGCPSRCSFCNLWRPNRGKYLTWSPDYVVDYLETIPEPYVLFVDDHFFGDIRRAFAIGELILRRGIQKQYCLYSRSDAVAKHPELIALWARAGLKRVRMGLESYDNNALDALTKCTTVETNDTAITVLKEHQILTEGLFMIHPDYTEREFKYLEQYITSRRIEVPNITVFTPMPGTAEYEAFRERFLYDQPWYFDFQHATFKTTLPLKQFCELYGALLLRVQRPPLEQFRQIGLLTFLRRMPNFWAYFFAVRRSYTHYRKPYRERNPLGERLPWYEASLGRCESPVEG